MSQVLVPWILTGPENQHLQVNLDMTDSMGPGKSVRLMQNPSYTYDEYLICIGLGPSISSVLCKNPLYSGPFFSMKKKLGRTSVCQTAISFVRMRSQIIPPSHHHWSRARARNMYYFLTHVIYDKIYRPPWWHPRLVIYYIILPFISVPGVPDASVRLGKYLLSLFLYCFSNVW